MVSSDSQDKTNNINPKWDEVIRDHSEANFLQSPEYKKMNEIMAKAFQIGLREMWNRGEFTAPVPPTE